MRRSERHHLKENAFAVAVGRLQGQLLRSGRSLVTAAVIGGGAVLILGGYFWWTGQTAAQAGTLLAEALVAADAQVVPPPAPAPVDADTTADPPAAFTQPPGTYPSLSAKMEDALPKLLEAADAYPATAPGITARYRAAAALAALGRPDEAAEQYQQVITRDGAGVYTRMATLGLADVHILLGAYDEAISLLEQSSAGDVADDLPVDGVLMRLAHAYSLAGRAGEARATYQRVMDDFPFSVYGANAEQEIEALQTEG